MLFVNIVLLLSKGIDVFVMVNIMLYKFVFLIVVYVSGMVMFFLGWLLLE